MLLALLVWHYIMDYLWTADEHDPTGYTRTQALCDTGIVVCLYLAASGLTRAESPTMILSQTWVFLGITKVLAAGYELAAPRANRCERNLAVRIDLAFVAAYFAGFMWLKTSMVAILLVLAFDILGYYVFEPLAERRCDDAD